MCIDSILLSIRNIEYPLVKSIKYTLANIIRIKERRELMSNENKATDVTTEQTSNTQEPKHFAEPETADAKDKQTSNVDKNEEESTSDWQADTGDSTEPANSQNDVSNEQVATTVTDDSTSTDKEDEKDSAENDEVKSNKQDDKLDSPEKPDKADRKKNKGRGKQIAIIIIVILAIACIAAGGYMMWKSQQPVTDPGATIQTYDGKSDKEIQDELNRQAEESRMTISVAPKVELKDGKARVNVVNTNDNKFNQTFTLEQDGKEIYKSGIIKSGEKVEWCDADGLKAGTNATITVQAVDKESGKPSGNPQSVDVEVVKGNSDSAE